VAEAGEKISDEDESWLLRKLLELLFTDDRSADEGSGSNFGDSESCDHIVGVGEMSWGVVPPARRWKG